MTIEDYIKTTDKDFYIENEYVLDFADSDSKTELEKNLEWVLQFNPTLEAVRTVMRSYYGNVVIDTLN